MAIYTYKNTKMIGMKGIDIHHYAEKIESVKIRVKNGKTSERNMQLVFEFMRDCQTGGGRKLTDERISKLIGSLKILRFMRS